MGQQNKQGELGRELWVNHGCFGEEYVMYVCLGKVQEIGKHNLVLVEQQVGDDLTV